MVKRRKPEEEQKKFCLLILEDGLKPCYFAGLSAISHKSLTVTRTL